MEIGLLKNDFSIYRWTKANGEYPQGDPELHDYVGTMLYNGKKEHKKKEGKETVY